MMKDNNQERTTFDVWAFRCLVGAAFGVAFSIAAGETLLGVSFLLFVIALVIEKRAPVFSTMMLAALLFVIVAALTAVFGVDFAESRHKLVKLLWLFAIPVAATLVSSPDRLKSVLKGFTLGCGVAACKVIFYNPWKAWKHGGVFLQELVYLGSMTYGQMLSIGIIVTLCFLAISRKEKKPACGWWILLAVQVLGLLLTFKRGSWFCAFLLVLAFVCCRYGWKYMVLLIPIAVILALLPPVWARLAGLRAELDTGKGGRVTMWFKIAPAMVREHPWLGVGYGAMSNRLMKKYAPEVEPDRSHLHSNIANIVAETGWLGLSIYLLWMILAIVDACRLIARNKASSGPMETCAVVLLLMLIGLIANGLVEYNFGDSEIKIMYCIIMGAAAGLLRAPEDIASDPLCRENAGGANRTPRIAKRAMSAELGTRRP